MNKPKFKPGDLVEIDLEDFRATWGTINGKTLVPNSKYGIVLRDVAQSGAWSVAGVSYDILTDRGTIELLVSELKLAPHKEND